MKKLKLPIMLLPALMASQAFAIQHTLEPAENVAPFAANGLFQTQAPANSRMKSKTTVLNSVVNTAQVAVQSTAETIVETTTITPICPTLSTGSLYTLENSAIGDINCYHFNIPERSKTTALLVGQSIDTNVDLSIIHHNPDDTFTVIGSSINANNQDEVVVTLTEPGDYYWYMEVLASDASADNFGASGATQLDAYEFNDTVELSTVLPDKQNKVIGNMDSIND